MNQWVTWRYDVSEKGEWVKTPYRVGGKWKAKTNNRSTWGAFDDAIATYADDSAGGWAGVGFVFSEDDPYCGVDLDGCRNPQTGVISRSALDIIEGLASYAEVSPSGTGVKLIIRAGKPDPRCRFDLGSEDIQRVEVYERGRFFALTGHLVEGSPTEVCEQQAALEMLYARGFRLGESEEPPATVEEQMDRLDREFSAPTRYPVSDEQRRRVLETVSTSRHRPGWA